MTAKPNITSLQLLFMAVGSALTFPYTFMPILNTPPANQDIWIVLIFSFFYVIITNTPVLLLMSKFNGFTMYEMNELILGKFFGKIISFMFSAFFIFCYATCLSIGAIFINMSILPRTPIWAILFFAVATISYPAYKGSYVIGKLAAFIVPFVMSTIIIFFLMGLNLMDFKILKPILSDSTFRELNLGAFLTASRYSEILIFLVFSFFLFPKAKKKITRTYMSALGVFAVFFLMILIPIILVLGIDFAKNQYNPYYIYTRQVHAYDFIQRVQSLNALAWFPGLLLKLTIYCFMASHTLSGIFKAKSHKPFVIPVTVLALSICMVPAMQKSSVIMRLASDQVFPWIILPVTFVLPLLLLLVYLIRKKKITGISEKNTNVIKQT